MSKSSDSCLELLYGKWSVSVKRIVYIYVIGFVNIGVRTNQHNKVISDLIQCIGNISESVAKAKQIIKVEDGGKVWLGSEAENVLQILSELIQVVADVANIAKDHTHEYTDNGTPMKTKKPNQSGDFGGKNGEADGLKGRLDPVVQ